MLKDIRERTLFRKIVMLVSLFSVVLGIVFFSDSYCKEVESSPRRHVRVGYYLAQGFQEYDPNTGNYSGSGYEYLMALKQYTNWEMELVPVEFRKGVEMLEKGELDLLNNVSKTPEREKKLLFSMHPSGANYGVLAVAESNSKYAFNDYKSFNSMVIGIREKSVFEPYFNEFCIKYDVHPQKIRYYATAKELSNALISGEIDTKIVSSSFHDNCRIVAKFAPMQYYMAVPKDAVELMQELDKGMEQIRTDLPNLPQQLEEKYTNVFRDKKVVLSKNEKLYVAQHEVIKVAATNNWAPVAYFNNDGEYVGVLADIYNKIAVATGLRFKFVKYDTYEESLKALEKGEVSIVAQCPYDFVFADKWHLQLTQKITEVTVYRVINENKQEGEIKSIALYGDTYLENKVKKYYGDNIRYFVYKNVYEAIEAVLLGDVDCTFVNYYSGLGYQNRGRYLSLKFILVPALKFNFAIGIAEKENTLLKSILGKGLSTVGDAYIDNRIQTEEEIHRNLDLEGVMYRYPRSVVTAASALVAIIVLSIGFGFYYKKISKKNMELEEARKSQTEFLSRMSHDMRTPMNGILGLSYLMEKENNIKDLHAYIPQLQEASNYLLQLINDVLDVNKISSGHMTLTPKVCNEERVFTSIIDMIEPQMKEKNIEFNFVKKNIQWKNLFLDEQRVKQVFLNLLNNAVKFTPASGRVDFIMELVSETDSSIQNKFIIRDNGVGISKEFMSHIFEPFQQENIQGHDPSEGTGLGLSIVKKLVELMNGSISVKSTKGVGTEFTLLLTFPLAKKDQKDDTVEVNNGKEHFLKRKGIKILLCEDQNLNAVIAKKLLAKEGAEITWAKNGQEGLDIFCAEPKGTFDIIFMDIRMPILDGLEATKRIRALDRKDAKTIPIIAMSANAYEEDIEKSLAAGINEHLAKPINPNILYEVINKYI